MAKGYGISIKEELMLAGPAGICCSDAWRLVKPLGKDGTYKNFTRYWYDLRRLKFIVPTGRTETSHARGHPTVLAVPRIFYRITPTGRRAGDADWSNPSAILNPVDPSERRDYMRPYMKKWRARRRRELIAMGLPVLRRSKYT